MSARPQLRVAVDVQHGWRPAPHKGDRGARFVCADGTVRWEIELALEYAQGIVRELRAVGVPVLVNDPAAGTLVGRYSDRARQAQGWGATVYLACHVNAGEGRYALSGFTHLGGTDLLPARSSRIGVEILTQLRDRFTALRGGELKRYGPLTFGGGTIRPAARLGIASVLVEPFFGDNALHRAQLIPQLGELGATIGRAVKAAWLALP